MSSGVKERKKEEENKKVKDDFRMNFRMPEVGHGALTEQAAGAQRWTEQSTRSFRQAREKVEKRTMWEAEKKAGRSCMTAEGTAGRRPVGSVSRVQTGSRQKGRRNSMRLPLSRSWGDQKVSCTSCVTIVTPDDNTTDKEPPPQGNARWLLAATDCKAEQER